MAGLLDGIRVVECAVLHVGDYLGCLLGDEGADVIKVETPQLGDYVREVGGQVVPGYSFFHLFENRNKRSVTLDLKKDAGKEAFRKLIATADVFITGNVADGPKRLGFDYDSLLAIKPDLVYCQATGFGAQGPYAAIPTHGGSINAITGDPALTIGDDGFATPDRNGFTPGGGMRGTIMGPLFAAYGVAAALSKRDRTGQPSYIDVSASDAVLAASWQRVMPGLNPTRVPDNSMFRPDGDGGRVSAKYTYYKTKDDRYVLLVAVERKFWEHFCDAVQRPDLMADYKSSGGGTLDMGADDDLRAKLAEIFVTRSQSEWLQIALDFDIALGPAFTSLGELAEDEHLQARRVFVDTEHPIAGSIRMPGNPVLVRDAVFEVRHHAPALGEQTEEILASLGYDAVSIDSLRSEGVIK